MPIYHIGESVNYQVQLHHHLTSTQPLISSTKTHKPHHLHPILTKMKSPLPPKTQHPTPPTHNLETNHPRHAGQNPGSDLHPDEPAVTRFGAEGQGVRYGACGGFGDARGFEGLCDASGSFGVSIPHSSQFWFSSTVFLLYISNWFLFRVQKFRDELCEDVLAYDLEF